MNYTLVGIFVLALGALLIGGVLWLASGGAWRKQMDLYSAVEEESVAGLNVNAPVKYNGVDVGKVGQIRLDPANPDRVLLTLAVEHGTPVREDTEAVLKTQGLTGIAYVELSGGTRGAPPLQASAPGQYPVIRTRASLSARLENVLTAVLVQLDNTTAKVDAVLSNDNRHAFAAALQDIATIARTIASRKAALESGIDNAARAADGAAKVAAKLGPLLERIGRGADAVERMGVDTAAASKVAGQTVETVGTDLHRFTGQTLPELQRLLGELDVLTTSLRRLSEQTERQPESLLFGRQPPPDGPGEGAPAGQKP